MNDPFTEAPKVVACSGCKAPFLAMWIPFRDPKTNAITPVEQFVSLETRKAITRCPKCNATIEPVPWPPEKPHPYQRQDQT